MQQTIVQKSYSSPPPPKKNTKHSICVLQFLRQTLKSAATLCVAAQHIQIFWI